VGRLVFNWVDVVFSEVDSSVESVVTVVYEDERDDNIEDGTNVDDEDEMVERNVDIVVDDEKMTDREEVVLVLYEDELEVVAKWLKWMMMMLLKIMK
jgi:hypothetical protein